jgi:U3 small nucleolar RNA-associated protein 25
MAKQSKKKDKAAKNKGPKGKKARAKAKLERQWGEAAVAPEADSQVLRGWRPDVKKNIKVRQEVDENERASPAGSDEDSSDDEDDDDQAVSSFVAQLQRQHRKDERHRQSSQQQLSPGAADQVMRASSDDDEHNDDTGRDVDATVDPFSDRFAVSDATAMNTGPLVTTTGTVTANVHKQPLDFVDEGVQLQCSTPTTAAADSPLPGADLPAWRHWARRLWQAQRPLLRASPRPKEALETALYPLVATYRDISCTLPLPPSDRLYAAHILNHVWTSRQRIHQHNKAWRALDKAEDKSDDGDDDDDEDAQAQRRQDPKFRDQGFTRPTVLVLLPTRACCFRLLETIVSLLTADDDAAPNFPVTWDRFVTEYGPPESDEPADPRRQAVLEGKGAEWLSLFGDDVNTDDDFKLGLALHLHEKQQRPTLKLYTDFYKSDIIFTSPLGLKMLAAKQSEADEDDDLEAEAAAPDYLSSIEICWLSQAHVLMMQNWDHVTDVMGWLNQRPKQTTDTDFARLRPYFLEDQQANWRQLILTAPYTDPAFRALFSLYAQSRVGTSRLTRKTPWPQAALTQITFPTRQVFQRVIVKSVQEQVVARLDYFGKHILPKISKQPFTLVFCPSYLEFVSLRNFLMQREADYYVSVTEYSRGTEVNRGRARFGQGRKSLLLYTGRAHFFHRHEIRGVRNVIWYGLPEDPNVYTEVVNWCQDESTQTKESRESPEASSLCLYTTYEALALERIVGHAHAARMTKGEKTTFLFAA